MEFATGEFTVENALGEIILGERNGGRDKTIDGKYPRGIDGRVVAGEGHDDTTVEKDKAVRKSNRETSCGNLVRKLLVCRVHGTRAAMLEKCFESTEQRCNV